MKIYNFSGADFKTIVIIFCFLVIFHAFLLLAGISIRESATHSGDLRSDGQPSGSADTDWTRHPFNDSQPQDPCPRPDSKSNHVNCFVTTSVFILNRLNPQMNLTDLNLSQQNRYDLNWIHLNTTECNWILLNLIKSIWFQLNPTESK